MNKFIVFPLVVMLIISFLGIYVDLTADPATADDPDIIGDGEIKLNSEGNYEWYYKGSYQGEFRTRNNWYSYDPRVNPDNEFYLVKGSDATYFPGLESFYDYYNVKDVPEKKIINNILNSNLLWGVIAAILGATAILGVSVFSSGLSEFSQRTIFLGIAYGVFWAFLSITSYDILMIGVLGIFGSMIYATLSIGYIIGIVQEVTSSGG